MDSTQQMFMLFFSILYGIMLNSVIGLGAFPIGATFAGKDVKERDSYGYPKWIEGSRSRNRLCLSVVFLNILPFIYFAVAFQFIDLIGDIPSTHLLNTIGQTLFIGFLSLGVFAFYQFFLGCVTWKPCGHSWFYTSYELDEHIEKRATYPSSRKHILGGVLYLFPLLVLVLLKAIGL